MRSVIDIVKDLQGKHKAENQEPDHVLMAEVLGAVREEALQDLRMAVRMDVLEYHRTLNSHAFRIKDE